METNQNSIDFNNIDLKKLNNDKKIIGIASLVAAVGTFLPWFSASYFGVRANVIGLKFAGGQILLVCSLLIIATVLEGKSNEKLSKRNTQIGLGLAAINALAILIRLFENNGLGFWISLLATVVTGALFFKALTGKDLLKEASQKANELKDKAEDKIEEMKKEKKTDKEQK